MNKGFNAILNAGKLNYQAPTQGSNPTSATGYAFELRSVFKSLKKTEIIPSQDAKADMTLELLIQIPLGDYGTDGYNELANIGTGVVNYSVQN